MWSTGKGKGENVKVLPVTVMKAYRNKDIVLLIPELYGGKWFNLHAGCFNPGKNIGIA